MTDAELRSLLVDCLALWGTKGSVSIDDDGMSIVGDAGRFVIHRADPEMRPVRWLLQTPERLAAGRAPRAAQSVVALLGALRNAMGVEARARLHVGG